MSASDRREIAEALARLCAAEIGDEYTAQCDREARYPHEAMDALAANGWAQLPVPESHGGVGASKLELADVHRTLARRSLAVGQAYFSLWVLGAESLARLGTADQKDRWLPRIADGTARIAFAITEPGAGSDAASITTSAKETADGFSISGQKVFTTGARVADMIIVVARTQSTARKHDGISLFLVDPAAPGVTVKPLQKMGLRSLDLCEVYFDEVAVGRHDVLGPLDGGWSALRLGFASERVFIAAICVGALEDVIERCTAHARDRESFGKPIGSYQFIGGKIVDMRVGADAAWLLTERAASLLDDGADAVSESSMAKLHASEAYVSATRDGVQVFGGYGFTEEYPIARHYRDAKFTEIGAGTSEIQRIIIGRSMGLL